MHLLDTPLSTTSNKRSPILVNVFGSLTIEGRSLKFPMSMPAAQVCHLPNLDFVGSEMSSHRNIPHIQTGVNKSTLRGEITGKLPISVCVNKPSCPKWDELKQGSRGPINSWLKILTHTHLRRKKQSVFPTSTAGWLVPQEADLRKLMPGAPADGWRVRLGGGGGEYIPPNESKWPGLCGKWHGLTVAEINLPHGGRDLSASSLGISQVMQFRSEEPSWSRSLACSR